MQGNLQLADGPFDGLVNATGAVAHAAAPFAAAATFTAFGAVLVLGVLAAYGLKKLAERARQARFKKLVMSPLKYDQVQTGSSANVLEPAE